MVALAADLPLFRRAALLFRQAVLGLRALTATGFVKLLGSRSFQDQLKINSRSNVLCYLIKGTERIIAAGELRLLAEFEVSTRLSGYMSTT